MTEMDADDKVQLAELRTDVKNLISVVSELTTKSEMAAVAARVSWLEKITFGGIAVVLVAVIGAVLTLVLRTPSK